MKMPMRILTGVIGLIVLILGIKQMYKGVHEMSGAGSAPPQKMGETFTSAENGYAHRIPDGWESKPGSQAGVTMLVAPSSTGLASNMVTTVEKYDGSLPDYVAANKQAVTAAAPDAKFLTDTEFVTETKATCHKVKLQNKVNNIDLAQTMYFFDGTNGRKIIVTCTAPAKVATNLESLFDDCMKTFTLK
jgi:hypothetical protein